MDFIELDNPINVLNDKNNSINNLEDVDSNTPNYLIEVLNKIYREIVNTKIKYSKTVGLHENNTSYLDFLRFNMFKFENTCMIINKKCEPIKMKLYSKYKGNGINHLGLNNSYELMKHKYRKYHMPSRKIRCLN